MTKQINILGILGSLRKNSYNRGLLQAAIEQAPAHCQIELLELHDIAPYNQDHETSLPASVAHLKAKVRAADAILIATPEYNYSMPGVLKNAIDWGSRPYGDNSWDNKPVAVMGASAGLQGTSRAQYHLRQVFVTLNMHPLNKPEIMIGAAQNHFDEHGHLTDPKTRKKVGELLEALIRKIP